MGIHVYIFIARVILIKIFVCEKNLPLVTVGHRPGRFLRLIQMVKYTWWQHQKRYENLKDITRSNTSNNLNTVN